MFISETAQRCEGTATVTVRKPRRHQWYRSKYFRLFVDLRSQLSSKLLTSTEDQENLSQPSFEIWNYQKLQQASKTAPGRLNHIWKHR
jgi:hypothetical protein